MNIFQSMGLMQGENSTNWQENFSGSIFNAPAFSNLPQAQTIQQLTSGQGKVPEILGANPSSAVTGYENSPYAKYFSGQGYAGLTPEQKYQQSMGETGGSIDTSGGYGIQNYDKITSAPAKLSSVAELLKLFPQAQYMSPQMQQQFADNYRLGLASLYDPQDLGTRVPFSVSDGAFQLRNGENNEGRYYSIQPGEISKLGFDPVKGFNTGTATISQPRGNFFENTLAPILKPLLVSGVLAGAGVGLSNLISGVGTAASGVTGAAGAGSAAGSGVGTFGAAADAALGTGMITSPSGLAGLVGAAPIGSTIPAVAGGMLNPALAGAAAGAVGSAASGGLGDFPFQSPSSISPVGETPALNNTGTGLSTVGSTPPDLGTGMITSPEGLSGLVNSPPIGTTLGAGTPGTTGGFLNPILGGAPLATTAAAGGLAQGASSVTDFLSNLFSKGADKFMENPLQNTVGILSALSSTSQGKDLADQLKALMNQGLSQSDPFGSQRAQYAAKLKQTYDDPNTYLGSDQYKGISRKRLEALERADAAQGRRSQYGARAEKMYEFDQENLMKERTMLAQLAGSGIQPGQVGNILSTLGAGSANAQVNANGQLYALLASMVKGS